MKSGKGNPHLNPFFSGSKSRFSTINEVLNVIEPEKELLEDGVVVGKKPEKFEFLKTKAEASLEEALKLQESRRSKFEAKKEKDLFRKISQISESAKTELVEKVNAYNTLSIYNLCDGDELFSFKSINVTTKKARDPMVEIGKVDDPHTQESFIKHILKNKYGKTTRARMKLEDLERKEPDYFTKTVSEVSSLRLKSNPELIAKLNQRTEYLKSLPESSEDIRKFIKCVVRGDLSSMYAIMSSNRSLVHRMDARCNTPLHYAVLHEMVDAVEFLLKKGADIDCKNICGDTPVDVSLRNNNSNIHDMLISHRNSLRKKKNKYEYLQDEE